MASTPTTAQLVEIYPEFSQAPAGLLQAKLDEAAARTNAAVWGDKYAQGVLLRAADLLAKTPQGRRLRLVSANGRSIYWEDLRTMVRAVAVGHGRVT